METYYLLLFYNRISHTYITIIWFYKFFIKQNKSFYSKRKAIKVVIFRQKQTKIFKYSLFKYANFSLVKRGDNELAYNMESYDVSDTNGRKVSCQLLGYDIIPKYTFV